MYKNGQGCDANMEQAIEFYEKAIAGIYLRAIHERAYMHEQGIGGPVDYPKAIALYNQAMEYGFYTSFHNCAYLYENNPEGDVDYPRARALYKQAIQLGSIMALTNLGLMHQTGRGGPVDLIEAARLYRRAAESQDRDALGLLDNRENPSIFHYHHAMSQKNYQRAAALMTNPAVLSEFILFDCGYWLSQKPEHFDAIETVLGLAKLVTPTQPPENDI